MLESKQERNFLFHRSKMWLKMLVLPDLWGWGIMKNEYKAPGTVLGTYETCNKQLLFLHSSNLHALHDKV